MATCSFSSKRSIVRRNSADSATDLGVHSVLRKVYQNRNVTAPEQLDYALSNLLPPDRLSNIQQTADIIVDAIQADAKILIAGDFDADGATGSAVGFLALTAFGARRVQYLCPDRQEFGYGLTERFVEFFAPAQPDLVITVDNGITSVAGVRRAKELEITVVVTDHHLPGEELPIADAIVNPRLPGDEFQSKNLAGVGVIFYVMSFVRRRLIEQNWFTDENIAVPKMAEYLDLVALGTIADVVPLDYNNRILVTQGLKRINARQGRYGIRCLLEEGGREIGNITAEDLAFVAGPRINAAGRLDDISKGIRCLVSDEESDVLSYIRTLEQLNIKRKEMEKQMVKEARREIDGLSATIASAKKGICLHDDNWHHGIVGLIASRIRELTGVPTVIFAPGDEGCIKGSGRSVKGLNLRDILANIAAVDPDLFLQYGGHAMAVGMTIEKANLNRFETLYQAELKRQLGDRSWKDEILSDGEISDFSLDAAEAIRFGGPWGQEFEAPIFDGEFELVNCRLLKDEHLKARLHSPSSGGLVDGIYFRYSTDHDTLPARAKYRIAYQLAVNEYNGRKSPQLVLIHMTQVQVDETTESYQEIDGVVNVQP